EFELQGSFLFRYRGVLPLVILALTIFAYVLHIIQSPPEETNAIDGFYGYICLFITFIGFGIRIYTVGNSPENTSGRNTKSQIADQLSTKGIYSIVRHPLYVGNFLMWFGIALLTQNIWFILAFIFMYWVYYERIMFAEEQYLRKKFGDTYLHWAAGTPAFIPNFKHYQSAGSRFKIKKVLKQEKTGLLLVFLMYFLFDEIGFDIINRQIKIRFDFWFYGMIIAIMAYAIIKILQGKTTIIN
ncbi:MAG: isoprenylcysteine carboxylmethyltransferase family protein, partial [Parafilimonas sp.]